MKFLNFIIGVVISILLVILGLVLANYLEHGAFLVAGAILVPVFGTYQFVYGQKQIGLAMLITSIPLALLGFAFVVASGLH